MNKRELHEAVQAEMAFAANKVASLRELERSIIKDIDYWTLQEEAARTVAIRLDIEAGSESSNSAGNWLAPEGETR